MHESSFDVHTTNSEALDYSCIVVLKNSNGTEVDSLQVDFSTTPQVNITVDQGNNGGDLKGEEAVQEERTGGG